MKVNIEHKISHREWDEAQLTPDQFIEFDNLYHSKNNGDDGLTERYSLYPTFAFDNGTIGVDESWHIDKDGRVSTSSFACGVMGFSKERGQYIETVYGREKELGQLTSINFTVEHGMLEVFSELEQGVNK